MRLLNVTDLSFRTFHGQDIPRYVVASHRWVEGTEATIKDVQKRRATDKIGYKKVEGFARFVREHIPDVEWIWIDTCCINQESDREVSEAVNSMFRWYSDAEACLAYLRDVEVAGDTHAFGQSEWFTRGWTLQELLAPHTVIFLTQNWEVVGHKGGDDGRQSGLPLRDSPPLEAIIARTTGIPPEVLRDYRQSQGFSVEQRLAWTHGRKTTCEEDLSYCLLGLFDITMPVIYGEGSSKARKRLLEEIYKTRAPLDPRPGPVAAATHTAGGGAGTSTSVAAVAALVAQTCAHFTELRKVCPSLPGRLHALNNEVTDLAFILDDVANLSSDPAQLRRDGVQQASVPGILSKLSPKLADVKSGIESLTSACSRSRIPLLQARAWSRVQGRLQTLQDEIRAHKSHLNVILGASKTQDLLRLRLHADALSTNTAVGAQLQTANLDELRASMSSNHADMTDMLQTAFQRVDERTAKLEQMMRAQEARFYRDHNEQLNGPTSENTENSVVPTQGKKDTLAVRTDAVGFRTLRYSATCRPGCPCACHKPNKASTPAVVDRVLGQLFIGYSGVPLLLPKCTDRRCHKLQATQINLEYWFPLGYFWSLILRAQFSYHASLGPQLQLSTLRRVPDDAQSVEFALAGNISGLKYLFEQGLASPRDVSATRGYSLLRWAMYTNHYEAVKFLFYEGADAEYGPAEMSHDNCYGTPKGRANAILLEEGRTPNEDVLRLLAQGDEWVDEQEYTLLHKAVIGLTAASLESAISQHPHDLDTPDTAGRTPLSWAAVRGDARAIGVLLAHGADPNVVEVHGNSILYNAVNRGGSALCARLLLEAGAHPNPVRAKGVKISSPLSNAVLELGDPLAAKTLLDFGADVDSCGTDGKTALIIAARTDNAATARVLLEYGANINATSATEDTPLTTAIKHNSHKVLKLLLDRWYEYSECPRLNGPNLLAIVASYADAETMSILITTDHLRLMYDRNLTKGDDFATLLRQRFDASDELTMLFHDLRAVIELAPEAPPSSEGFFGSFVGNKGAAMAHLAADVEKAHSAGSDVEDEEFEDALEKLELGLDVADLQGK